MRAQQTLVNNTKESINHQIGSNVHSFSENSKSCTHLNVIRSIWQGIRHMDTGLLSSLYHIAEKQL